jgi:hypothetical protein
MPAIYFYFHVNACSSFFDPMTEIYSLWTLSYDIYLITLFTDIFIFLKIKIYHNFSGYGKISYTLDQNRKNLHECWPLGLFQIQACNKSKALLLYRPFGIPIHVCLFNLIVRFMFYRICQFQPLLSD